MCPSLGAAQDDGGRRGGICPKCSSENVALDPEVDHRTQGRVMRVSCWACGEDDFFPRLTLYAKRPSPKSFELVRQGR